MKAIFTLTTILLLLNIQANSQVAHRNFQVEKGEIIWQKVIETNMNSEEIMERIKDLGIIGNMSISDNKILGDLRPIAADFKGAGYSVTQTPIFISQNLIDGFVAVEFRDEKYRITIRRILFTHKDDPLSSLGKKSTIESYGLNRNNEFNNSFQKSASEILDYTFSKIFEFTEISNTAW
jgi:hypothetical protein